MKKVKGKVVVVGEPAVGKTTLISLFASNGSVYAKDYVMTQAAEVQSKIVTVEKQDQDIELFFFDLGGQEVYKDLLPELAKGAQLQMICFDCTNVESFQNVQQWYDFVNKTNGKSLPGVLVSCKNDLREMKQIDYAEGKQLAKQLNLEFFETSAARNIDVNQPFTYLASKLSK